MVSSSMVMLHSETTTRSGLAVVVLTSVGMVAGGELQPLRFASTRWLGELSLQPHYAECQYCAAGLRRLAIWWIHGWREVCCCWVCLLICLTCQNMLLFKLSRKYLELLWAVCITVLTPETNIVGTLANQYNIDYLLCLRMHIFVCDFFSSLGLAIHAGLKIGVKANNKQPHGSNFSASAIINRSCVQGLLSADLHSKAQE